MKKLIQLFVLIFWCTILVCGCSQKKENSTAEERKAARWAEKTLAGLSVERKVAQLICTDISGVYVPDDSQKFQSWIKLAGEYGIGGFVLYKGTPYNVAILLNRLQKEAEIPLLISADFEGGAGQQVTGASEFPGNMAFAATRDYNLMYEATKVMAEEGRAMGIHLSYTPATDVTLSPENPQESVRSFGGDIDLIGGMLTAYVRGFTEFGMLTTSKHFPGRGDIKKFPEYPGFNYLDKTEDEYINNEFRVLKYAVDAGVSFIMTEHLAVPSITNGSELPASVEPLLIKGIIRNKLGFKGIITTDDLLYEYVVNRFGAEEVAIRALEAGHDILLKPKDPIATIQAVVDAVQSGRIKEEQIDESVYKLLYYKALLGLNKNRFVDETKVGEKVGTVAHKQLITEVADKSITLLKNDNILPIKNITEKSIVNIIVQKIENQAGTDELAQKMSSAFNGSQSFKLTPSTAKQEYEIINKAADRSDLIILSFFVQRERHVAAAPLREDDLAFINKIIERNPGTVIAMSYGNPYIISKIESVPVFLTGYGEGGWYGNQSIYFDSFIKILRGELSPSGKLPVSINSGLNIGFGLTF